MNTKQQNTKTNLFDLIYLLSLPAAAILYFINL